MDIKISAVLITKNEEEVIERCLKSLLWCDEIVILDSMSTDKTKSIANKYNVKFFEQSFLGYGPQKIMAVSKATHNWILSIDADEEITPTLANEIKQCLQLNPDPKIAYKIPRSLIFMKKKFNFSGESKRPILRLFNRTCFNFNNVIVHEEVIGNGLIKTLSQEMYHYSYKNWNDYVAKLNHYTDKMAEKLKQQNSSKTAQPCLRFFTTFFRIFILKLGFLDGKEGFTWAISSSYANMLKYLKFEELFSSPTTKD